MSAKAGFHNGRVKYLQIVTSTMKRIKNKHADIHKYSKSIYLQDSWIMLFQKVRVAIFLLKHEIDLLSLIYCGMEFQIEAPSYIKLFFILFVFGFGKRIELELSRRLWFNISVLKVNNSLNEFGLKSAQFFLYTLYIQYRLLIYLIWHMCKNTSSSSSVMKFL